MADATSKTSFLGSISPWSRSNTPPPKSPRQLPKADALTPSRGIDHSISLRPSPSLRRYPKDCPPLKTRWYYAVDVPKRKPTAPEQPVEKGEKLKPPPAPKKFVAFSNTDSQAIENAFQALDTDAPKDDSSQTTSTRIPVNENYLFDVHIEKRELEPAYWLGPIYEVRRGSWFFDEGSSLRACDENLANQLEEGYLKVAPWRRPPPASIRSASQPRSRPSSMLAVKDAAAKVAGTATPNDLQTAESSNPNSHRLFGTHMNTTVTYQDAKVAYLAQDDLMSRMTSSVYGRFGTFGGFGGTRVVRGWSDFTKAIDTSKPADISTKDKPGSNITNPEGDKTEEKAAEDSKPADGPPQRTALERQLSSLAGLGEGRENEEKLAAEEAQAEQEREMEEAREREGDDQARTIDHLVLVTHGIGQRLGLRLDSINFVHDVNTMRKTMKAVYDSAPDLQAISGDPKNCRIQVLPICWRHLLDFPKQSLRHSRKESDLADVDADLDEDYPSLQDITIDGVPAVRNLITDLAMDVLLYQSAYREHIASIVQKECNRVFNLFTQRTGFKGKVSICGHSLGSAVAFDILCRQEGHIKTRPRRVSSKTSRDAGLDYNDLKLDFLVENFFAVGSPIALFQMLKGRTISGRDAAIDKNLPLSPFDSDPMTNDPFDASAKLGVPGISKNLLPISTSSPKCAEFFNIFHPTDPIAYRIEPLISPAMAQLKPQSLPFTKKGLLNAPGIANISQRVGQQVMSSWYNLTSGVASTLINRSLGITGEEQALPQDRAKQSALQTAAVTEPATVTTGDKQAPVADPKKQQDIADAAKATQQDHVPTLIDTEIETLYAGFQKRRRSHTSTASDEPSGLEYEMEQERARKLKREEAKVKALNSNGRVDYHIQEGMFDLSLLASIASHLSYWADEDCNHFIMGQMLKKTGKMEQKGK